MYTRYSFPQSSSNNKPSLGITLLLNFFLGILGIDKFYAGKYDIGIIQLILSLTFVGLALTIPWVFLCTISLLIAILYGGLPFLYPGVDWAPLTQTDKKIAWVVLIFMIFASLIQLMTNYKKTNKESKDSVKKNDKEMQIESYICPYCGRSPCSCRRGMGRGIGMGMGMGMGIGMDSGSGCKGCSRGVAGYQ
jgi:TM2 domain-containing membrane protein YozV